MTMGQDAPKSCVKSLFQSVGNFFNCCSHGIVTLFKHWDQAGWESLTYTSSATLHTPLDFTATV